MYPLIDHGWPNLDETDYRQTLLFLCFHGFHGWSHRSLIWAAFYSCFSVCRPSASKLEEDLDPN